MQQTRLASAAFAITPNDGTDLSAIAYGLWIGTAGTLKITSPNGVVATFANVPAGLVPVMAKRVWATGTSATGIMGLEE